jgi:HTH-type transcriptional regulator / antitoxin HipB
MHHPASTPAQVRAILRSLRRSRGLTQAQLGRKLGVSQKRIARIEAAPGVTSFDQIVRFAVALGGRIVVDDGNAAISAEPATPATPATRKIAAARTRTNKVAESW